MPNTKENPKRKEEKTAFFFPTIGEGVTVFADSREEALALVDSKINKS